MVEVAVDPSARFPTTPCCNCGAIDELAIIEAPISWGARVDGKFVLRRSMALPFCPACRASAHRPHTSIAWLGFLWLAAFLIAMAYAGDVLHGLGRRGALVVIAAVVSLPFALRFALARPRGAQTSYRQPVRYHAPTLRFTNETYARRLVEDNPGLARLIVDVVPHAAVHGAGTARAGARLRHAARVARRIAPLVLGFLILFALALAASFLLQ